MLCDTYLQDYLIHQEQPLSQHYVFSDLSIVIQNDLERILYLSKIQVINVNFGHRILLDSLYTDNMGLYDHTMKEIDSGHKNNLDEKMRGSNKYEFKSVCEKLEKKYGLKSHDLMGLGTSCLVYKYGKKSVIKVCAKKIKFFHDQKDKSAEFFKQTVAPLAPYFLPVEKIIHDGDAFFAYVQPRCTPLLKHQSLTTQDICDLLSIIETMFSHGLIIGQLKPKNVGYYEGRLVLFDFHSLHPLYDRIKTKSTWYHSLEESLIKYNSMSSMVDLKPLIESIKTIATPDQTQAVLQQIKTLKTVIRASK